MAWTVSLPVKALSGPVERLLAKLGLRPVVKAGVALVACQSDSEAFGLKELLARHGDARVVTH